MVLEAAILAAVSVSARLFDGSSADAILTEAELGCLIEIAASGHTSNIEFATILVLLTRTLPSKAVDMEPGLHVFTSGNLAWYQIVFFEFASSRPSQM